MARLGLRTACLVKRLDPMAETSFSVYCMQKETWNDLLREDRTEPFSLARATRIRIRDKVPEYMNTQESGDLPFVDQWSVTLCDWPDSQLGTTRAVFSETTDAETLGGTQQGLTETPEACRDPWLKNLLN